MKHLLFIFLVFCQPLAMASYPWVFLRESEPSETLIADTHASYFIEDKQKYSVLSGLSLNYHNPMVDLDLGYSYSYFEEQHYARLSELSVTFPFLKENWTMSIGVKDTLWSETDRYWNYGLWQARYLLDPLRPVQMGMPGVHWSYQNQKGSSFLLSVSYLHLPDMVISPQLSNNNELFSKNPLFTQKISAQIEELTSIFQLENFLRPSLATLFQHEFSVFSLRFAYAWKTMNQAHIALLPTPEYINLSEEEAPKKTKNDIPLEKLGYSFVSHHLLSLETEVQLFDKASLFASLFYEKPDKPKLATDQWETLNIPPNLTFSVLAYFQEKWTEHYNTLFTIGYTKSQTLQPSTSSDKTNPIITDIISRNPATHDIFKRNFDWNEAISGSVEYENKKFLEGIIFRLRGLYALDNQFYQVALESYLYLSSHFRVYGSGDLFFRSSDEAIANESSAIKKYKNSSRVLLGGQIVF